ncbi:hypothetical protein IPM62_05100 [Candidatus Woesebacteria bacterium]|nr:MAG: hypothetical protein IPM62_05100 [Candidatus Woesebacteria bacterium]
MNKRILLALSIIVTSVLVFSFHLFDTNKNNENNISPTREVSSGKETKTFTSSNVLNFSIVVPSEYDVTESVASVDIINSNNKISIIRNSTNHANLIDYLSYHDSLRNIENTLTIEEMIDGYESAARISHYTDIDKHVKSYFIFINSDVYILSTEDEEMYEDLDRIAKSFKYLP